MLVSQCCCWSKLASVGGELRRLDRSKGRGRDSGWWGEGRGEGEGGDAAGGGFYYYSYEYVHWLQNTHILGHEAERKKKENPVDYL